MKARTLAILFALPLGACASWGPGAQQATSIIETPLRIAFSVPTCLGYIATVGPSAIASAVVPFDSSKDGSGADYYKNRTAQACGGPFVAAGTPPW